MQVEDFGAKFEVVACKTFHTKKISATVGRVELFGASEFVFKSRAENFVFQVTDAEIDFELKNLLRKNFVALANVSNETSGKSAKFFCLRVVFFVQSVRFNLPVVIPDELKSTLTGLGENFQSAQSMKKFFQFSDGFSENCFAFTCSGAEKTLTLHAKNYQLTVRVTGNFALAEKITFGESSEKNFLLGLGEIKFNVRNSLPQRVTDILFKIPDYIKVWNEYAEREGDFLLDLARAVGEITYKPKFRQTGERVELKLVPSKKFDLAYVSIGEFLELRTSPPPYIKNSSLTWRDYQKLNVTPAPTYEVLRKDSRSLTLSTPEIFPPGGKLYLSITGSEKQIERRALARQKIETGKSALPTLGMILGARLEKNLQSSGIIFPARQKVPPMSALVREKIFTAEPTANQLQALDIAINTPDIAVIQGPPGTGKTTIIAAILERLNEISFTTQAGQVLVTSLQHDAVQNILDRISINSMPTVKFSRSANALEENVSAWREEIIANLEEKVAAEKVDGVAENFLSELKNNSDVDRVIRDYNFAFAATAQQSDRVEIRRAKKAENYDTVIVDEAARITPGDLMIPISQAERRIILVGDQRQLPHIYDEEIFQSLQEDGKISDSGDEIRTSMFEQLWLRAKELEKVDGRKRTITLDSQFRMHPTLGKFISENFYDAHGEGFQSPRPAEEFQQKISPVPVRWVNLTHKHGKSFRTANCSLCRPCEVTYIVNELQDYLTDAAHDNLTFGVVSFYRAQVQAIKREINSLGKEIAAEFEARVRVGTVDEFQGMEFDVMFLSVVRSGRKFDDVDLKRLENPPPESDAAEFAEWRKFVRATGRKFYGFFNDNRLCVALSRQKKLLIVVGESAMFNGKISARVAKICVPALYNLLQLCKQERSLISV